jgi:hypothetical protein
MSGDETAAKKVLTWLGVVADIGGATALIVAARNDEFVAAGVVAVVGGLIGLLLAWTQRRAGLAALGLIVMVVGVSVIGYVVVDRPGDAVQASPTSPTSPPAPTGPSPSAGLDSASPSWSAPGGLDDPATLPAETDATTESPMPVQGEELGVPLAGPDRPDGLIATRTDNASYTMDVDADDVSVNGTQGTHGWYSGCKLFCGANETSYVDLNLGRKYDRLVGAFGVDDSSNPGAIKIQALSLDGGRQTQLFSKTYELGEGGKTTIKVTGVLRLRIAFTGPLGRTHGAVADPTLF